MARIDLIVYYLVTALAVLFYGSCLLLAIVMFVIALASAIG